MFSILQRDFWSILSFAYLTLDDWSVKFQSFNGTKKYKKKKNRNTSFQSTKIHCFTSLISSCKKKYKLDAFWPRW